MHTLPAAILHCRLAGQDERREEGGKYVIYFSPQPVFLPLASNVR